MPQIGIENWLRLAELRKLVAVTEEYTSAQCRQCAVLHPTLGSAKTFRCANPACRATESRDGQAAKSILMLAIIEARRKIDANSNGGGDAKQAGYEHVVRGATTNAGQFRTAVARAVRAAALVESAKCCADEADEVAATSAAARAAAVEARTFANLARDTAIKVHDAAHNVELDWSDQKRCKEATAELAHVSSWADNASAALNAALLAAGGVPRRTAVPMRPFERGPPPAKTPRRRKESAPKKTLRYAAENDAKRLADGLGDLAPLRTTKAHVRPAAKTAPRSRRRGKTAPADETPARSADATTQNPAAELRRSQRARTAAVRHEAVSDDDDAAVSDDDAQWSPAQKRSRRHGAATSAAERKARAPSAAARSSARASATALSAGHSAPTATASPSAASAAALSAPLPVASAAVLSPGLSVPSDAIASPCAVLPSTPGGVHEWLAPLSSAGPACDASIGAYETN